MPTPSANHRLGLRLFNLLLVNVIAVVGAAAIYWAVAAGDGANAFFSSTLDFLLRHETLMVLAAVAPLLATLLVGYGYMQRARRRRSREQALAALAAARAAGSGHDPGGGVDPPSGALDR